MNTVFSKSLPRIEILPQRAVQSEWQVQIVIDLVTQRSHDRVEQFFIWASSVKDIETKRMISMIVNAKEVLPVRAIR